MLEAESVRLVTVNALCEEIESLTRLLVTRFLDRFSPKKGNCLDTDDEQPLPSAESRDMALVYSSLSHEDTQCLPKPGETKAYLSQLATLESSISKSFARLTFAEACSYLDRPGDKYADLSKEDERRVLSWIGQNTPVFLTRFPCSLKPFYCQSLDGLHAEAVDLLVPGVGELVGGSVRETCPNALIQRLTVDGTDAQNLDWYIKLRGLGGAPHGGFGLGFERLLQFLTGTYNIRDVIPFPRAVGRISL
ncbi:putative Asparaginyl-tRNA synthetase 2 mitochondrial (putative) [Fasciola gigantica]|uniref:Putative Asparaginyl-tRNA synthetase 2 mitochondrial (Putative) n=1 Tax=Fasciola gigantica TaxID=46835 RepID=A0A504YHH4_FASGI|nr:putative Asparaginyl-tRNA synthetase 2 mitochondrial (putative) [Fasciola gigantica]